MKTLLFLIYLFLPFVFLGQNLKPSIGLSALPGDNDTVCTIPVYKGSFYVSGYFQGDTVPDFTLYTPAGQPVNLQSLLLTKPVLLVAGSYTCPVFRNKLTQLNNLTAQYSDNLHIFIVYTVEAHPIVDVSPYSGTVWVTAQNQQEDVLYRQPKTYGERKQIISEMKQKLSIQPEILIDGPCNMWWLNYGPAPNNAYLIDKNGVVFSKHGWFNKAPLNMKNDIDSLLGNQIDGGGNGKGSFTVNHYVDSLVGGNPGEILNTYAVLRNNSGFPVWINVERTRNSMPPGWETAMCIDICLLPEEDTTSAYLMPGDTQLFTFYFYTNSTSDAGVATILFTNKDSINNNRSLNFYGTTIHTTSLNHSEYRNVRIYPNPSFVNDEILIFNPDGEIELDIFSATGKIISRRKIKAGAHSIPAAEIGRGYFIFMFSDTNGSYFRKIIVH